MNSGKLKKYLAYAIGEILLVMIGILLALQVNNWNQDRINKNKERLLLNELHREFLDNRIQFDSVIESHKHALQATENIVAMFPIDVDTLDLQEFIKKRAGMRNHPTFNPSQGVINSILNTSSFEIISNDSLRRLLISWKDVLKDYLESENEAFNNYKDQVVPFFRQHVPFMKGELDKRMNLSIMETFEYENVWIIRLSDLRNIFGEQNSRYLKVYNYIDQIIELSDPNRYD